MQVYSNGAVFTCPSLFHGRAIVTLGAGANSIAMLMMATNPDLHYMILPFQQLTAQYTQCIFMKVTNYVSPLSH